MKLQRMFQYLLPWISTPLLIISIFGLWKYATVALEISPFILPSPEDVVRSFTQLLKQREVWAVHVRTTFIETIAGFCMALVLGVIIGALLGKFVWLERALRPMIIGLQIIPKVALVPLFIIFFGFGMTSKVVIAGILAFFPIMLNVLLGVRSVDPGLKDVMRSFNAGWWATFWSLEYHSTLPYVFTGMETGIIFATIGAIVGEYLGGNEGLGYLVVASLNAFDAPELFAVILLLTSLSYLLYFVIHLGKRLLIPWHESMQYKE